MGDQHKEETKEAPTAPAAGAPDEKKKNTFSAVAKSKNRLGRTEEYVDDRELYVPRISSEDRNQYWQQLLQNKTHLLPPPEFDSWVNQNSDVAKQLENFDPRLIRMVKFITSCRWDFAYIYGLMLWSLLVPAIVDGFVPESLGLTYQSSVALLPIVVSLLSQIIPSIGIVLLMHRCNDLVKLLAESLFTEWSFAAVLLAQYIEFFYYGGQGREDMAGKVFGMKDNVSIFAIIRVFLFGCRHVPSQVHPEFDLRVTDGAPLGVGIDLENSIEEDDDEEENEDDDEDDDNDTADQSKEIKAIGGASASAAAGGVPNVAATQNPSVKTNNILAQASIATTKSKVTLVGGSTAIEEEDDGEEIGYLAQIQRQERRRLAEEKRQKKLEQEKRELECTDWEEWICVVCGKSNRRPRVNPVEFHINFGVKGVYYKRHYAQLKQSSTKPTCTHCYTPSDYKPQLATAHLFSNNPKMHQAFENYPKRTTLHPGLKTDKYSVTVNKYMNIFFGLNDDPKSKIVYNDWRLPKLLALQFPQVPRYKNPSEEY